MDNLDDDVIVRIVENGEVNQALTLNAQEHVLVALRNHNIALERLQQLADGLVLPMQHVAPYINSAALLHDPTVHKQLLQVFAPLAQAVINTSAAAPYQQEIILTSKNVLQQNLVESEEL